MAYGLGRALIEARSLKGLVVLPRRLLRLRLKQKAKRRARVPDTLPKDAAAHLRFVDEALDLAKSEGMARAAEWLRARRGNDAPKARAMAELAIAAAGDDLDLAAALGSEAARLSPAEPRLLTVIAALRDTGLVRAPHAIGAAIENAQPLSDRQRELIEELTSAVGLLDGESPSSSGAGDLAKERNASIQFVCHERWAASLRIAGCRAAANAAGLAATMSTFGGEDGGTTGTPPAAFHVFPRSLEEAQDAVLAAQRAAAPVIVDIGGIPPFMLRRPESEAAEVERRRLAWLHSNARKLIVRGAALAEAAAALNIETSPVFDPSSLGLPAKPEVEAAKREFGLSDDAPLMACIGTGGDDPGFVPLLRACARLRSAGKLAQLAVIGGETMRLALEAGSLGGGDWIVFLGQPLPERAPVLLRAFDLVVFPRRNPEPLGSEMPMWMAAAAGLGVRMHVSEGAWLSRSHDHAGNPPPLGGDIAESLESAIAAPPPSPVGKDGSDLAAIYREMAATL